MHVRPMHFRKNHFFATRPAREAEGWRCASGEHLLERPKNYTKNWSILDHGCLACAPRVFPKHSYSSSVTVPIQDAISCGA